MLYIIHSMLCQFYELVPILTHFIVEETTTRRKGHLRGNFDEFLEAECESESEKHLGDHALWTLPPGPPPDFHGK